MRESNGGSDTNSGTAPGSGPADSGAISRFTGTPIAHGDGPGESEAAPATVGTFAS